MRNYRSGNHLLNLCRLFTRPTPLNREEHSGVGGNSETLSRAIPTEADFEEAGYEGAEFEPDAPFESESEYSNSAGFPSRFFGQAVVALICLIMVMLLTQSDHPSTRWIRNHLHSAVNASSDATFGYISRTETFQRLAKNLENLVRLEEITKKLSEPRESLRGDDLPVSVLPPGTIWPVQGRIVRNFGWQESSGNRREFYPDLEFAINPGTEVLAIRKGTVSAIQIQPQSGGAISLDHGNGLISTYRYLNQFQVRIGQTVRTGTVIGRAAGSILSFEIRQDNRAVDPLSIIGSQYAAN